MCATYSKAVIRYLLFFFFFNPKQEALFCNMSARIPDIKKVRQLIPPLTNAMHKGQAGKQEKKVDFETRPFRNVKMHKKEELVSLVVQKSMYLSLH